MRCKMELSPRLKKIAELIPQGSVIADVGTDHAYIPVYCFQNNIIKKAIAMDVNPMPLKRAEQNLEKYGFLYESELRLSDGIEKLSVGEADVIVIAGMGGLLIRDIIDAGKDKITASTLMLIQPMIAPAELSRRQDLPRILRTDLSFDAAVVPGKAQAHAGQSPDDPIAAAAVL